MFKLQFQSAKYCAIIQDVVKAYTRNKFDEKRGKNLKISDISDKDGLNSRKYLLTYEYWYLETNFFLKYSISSS